VNRVVTDADTAEGEAGMTRAGRKWSGGRRRVIAAAVTIVAAGGLALAAEPAQAASLCVGSGGGCYPTIQAAVDAAHAGDTITIGAGTFAGGVTITKSVRLQGAGGAATIIRGGDHVLTIGAYGAASEPTVSISGVTVTGGLARSSPESVPLFGKAGVWAEGGGIEIPPGADLADGATVTIIDSVITGNRVNSMASLPSGFPCPGSFPQGQCPFAPALGGGIDSWGALTLIRTAVTSNSVGGEPGMTSDADGAGIFSLEGSLTLDGSVVSGNHSTAVPPAGRYAEGAGIFAGAPDFGPNGGHDVLVIRNSVVSGNVATLTSNLPSLTGGKLLDQKANGGGVLVPPVLTFATPTTIENSQLTNNSVLATDLNGEPVAINAAISVNENPLTMANSVVSGNRAVTEAATETDQGAAGDTLEIDGGGTIRDSRITDNYSAVVSPHGLAAVAGALGLFGNTGLLTVRDTTISGNTAVAQSTTGSVSVQGGGVFNGGLLTLIDDTVSGNSGKATGPSGVAQGGGIWNGTDFTGPPVQLALEHTTVTRNSVAGSHGVKVQGGGLFSAPPATVVLRNSLITLNVPDQCSGC
jgi:hypothetical protein